MALSRVLNKNSEERDAKSTVQSQILRARTELASAGVPNALIIWCEARREVECKSAFFLC